MVKVSLTWGDIAGLTRLAPQPFCPGLFYGSFDKGSGGAVGIQGRPHTFLEFNITSDDGFVDILDQLNLSEDNPSQAVCILFPNNRREHIIHNGYANYPEPGREFRKETHFVRAIRITVDALRVP
jgi:hypothetical protein